MSDDVLLATRCGEQCSPVSLFVDTFHSCYKVSITKLTIVSCCAAHALWAMRRTRVLALTWNMRKNKEVFFVLHMRSSLNTSCLLPQSTGILGASRLRYYRGSTIVTGAS